jgi:capsular exopolysaccharide synthesis family protein
MNNGNGNGHTTNGSRQDGVREINLRDLFATIVRGKWIILLVTFLVFDIFLIKTLREEPVYEAKTTVYISRGQAMPLTFMGGGGKNIINELEILKSRSLATNVAQQLLDRRYLDPAQTEYIPIILSSSPDQQTMQISALETVANRVQRAVTFSQVPGSDIILVSARSINPKEAALIADTYAETYYRRNFEGSRAQSVNVRRFLESQLRERKEALQEAENRLQRYQEREGIVIVDAESRRVITQIAQLEARKAELDVAINSVSSTVTSLQEQLAIQEPGVARNIGSGDNPYIGRLQQQIADLEIQRDRVIAQNPEVVGQDAYNERLKEIDQQIGNLKTTLQKRTQEFLQELTPGDEGFLRGLKQRIIESNIELQGLRIQQNAIEAQLRENERQLNLLPHVNMEFARLERAKLSNEKLYLMIEEKYNEAIITEQSEFGSVSIIDPALVPRGPVSPNMTFNLTIGLVLGLILGVGFVFLKEALSSSIKSPEDLRKAGYTTLAVVAIMYNAVKKISRKKRISIYGKSIDAFIIALSDPMSPISESFRGLRTNLQYSQVDKPVKTILITSANPGEGKSLVSANLAVTYAQAGKRVLLVDADLRKPNIHNGFDLRKKPGLTTVLFGEQSLRDSIQKSVVDNLDILTAGTIPANPADLLGSQKMNLLHERFMAEYDMVIFDSPPTLAATDSAVLGTTVDGVIIVVSSKKTKIEDLDATRDSIESVNGKVLGVVLNYFDQSGGYGTSYAQRYYRYGSYGRPVNGKDMKKVIG